MLKREPELFPIKKEFIYLSHCSVSPLYYPAFLREKELTEEHCRKGIAGNYGYREILQEFHEAGASLCKTEPTNIAFMKNTTEGISLIANGYPFEAGDQIVGYTHEYPANYYPWKMQEKKGVEFIELPNRGGEKSETGSEMPFGWSFDDLERSVSSRTKIVALSHVQFTSGFAADIKRLGEFCYEKGIDLVIDAAQSLGTLPVYPEEYHISAVASSGWKWMCGPLGTGILYTSPKLRDKLQYAIAGADMMKQGTDYLDHRWNPVSDAGRFEYSTVSLSLAAGLTVCINELSVKYGLETIRDEIFRLQDIIIKNLDPDKYGTPGLPDTNRSGILSVLCKKESSDKIAASLAEQKIICSPREGYLRIAPHFYTDDDEIYRTISFLNGR
ncbi:MAG: aminotransferase class V-fold PLP-dependent enzyme [Chitinivibrionales bacterium]|nr:aminotransferase class V-fold PLP-dependent enzyme [Chitinivibrionales bacterium]